MIAHLLSATLTALVAVAAVAALRRDRASWRHAILLAAILRFAVPTEWLRVMPPAAARFDWRIVWALGATVSLGLWWRRALVRVPAVREPNADELRMLPGVPLRIVDPRHAPGAYGLFRQWVVLPDGLSEHLREDELRAIVAHEMGHVRRLQSAPMSARVVWLERRMLAERETACDEMALGQGVSPESYVSGIAKICRLSFAGAAGAGGNGSTLQRRMAHIMFTTSTFRSSRWLPAVAGVAIAAVTLLRGRTRPRSGTVLDSGVARNGRAAHDRRPGGLCRRAAAAGRVQDAANRNPQLTLGSVLVRGARYSETYRRQGDDTASVAMLEKARHLAPENVIILSTLALTTDHAGDHEGAKRLYREVLTKQEHGVALNNLAYLTSRDGNLDEALALARRAKAVLPNTQEVDDTLGWIYLKRGDTRQAVSLFAGLVKRAPSEKSFRDHLALALEQSGDGSAEVRELQALLRQEPTAETESRIRQLAAAFLH